MLSRCRCGRQSSDRRRESLFCGGLSQKYTWTISLNIPRLDQVKQSRRLILFSHTIVRICNIPPVLTPQRPLAGNGLAHGAPRMSSNVSCGNGPKSCCSCARLHTEQAAVSLIAQTLLNGASLLPHSLCSLRNPDASPDPYGGVWVWLCLTSVILFNGLQLHTFTFDPDHPHTICPTPSPSDSLPCLRLRILCLNISPRSCTITTWKILSSIMRRRSTPGRTSWSTGPTDS